MSLDWSHLTGASLAVAIGLTALAALAWLQLWARPGDDQAAGGDDAVTRVARDHLPALSQWALGALALHALCLIGNGSGSFGGWAITIVLALAATGLQHPPGPREADDEPEPERPAPRTERVAADPVKPVGAPLWAGHADEPVARAGLWGETPT